MDRNDFRIIGASASMISPHRRRVSDVAAPRLKRVPPQGRLPCRSNCHFCAVRRVSGSIGTIDAMSAGTRWLRPTRHSSSCP